MTIVQLLTIALAMAAADSPWAEFSSQAAPPFSIAHAESGPAGVALLHDSASIGVSSFSGHPTGYAYDCNALRTSLLPDARSLAEARAQRFASELGVTLGALVHEDIAPPLHPNSQAYSGYSDFSGCGLPKYGKPPFTVGIHETYAVTSTDFAVGSDTAPPSPEPTPRFARPVELPPLLPTFSGTLVSVEARGVAEEPPSVTNFELLLTGPDRAQPLGYDSQAQDDALLAPYLAAARRIVPDAIPDTTTSASTSEFEGHAQLAHARFALMKPTSQTVRDLDRAFARIAEKSKAIAFVTRTSLLESCEALEDAARLDAIDRARRQLVTLGYGGRHLSLVFADEQPPTVDGGTCGPVLDGSFLYAQLIRADDDMHVSAEISAAVAIKLEFQDPGPA